MTKKTESSQTPEYHPEVFLAYYASTTKPLESIAPLPTAQNLTGQNFDATEDFAEMDKLYSDVIIAKGMAAQQNPQHISAVYLDPPYARSSPLTDVPHDGSHKSHPCKQPTSFARIRRFWELFPFILPPKIKREIYEPAFNDLYADFLEARRFKTKPARSWLTFSFVFRTLFMVGSCFAAIFTSGVGRLALTLVPWTVRRFFSK